MTKATLPQDLDSLGKAVDAACSEMDRLRKVNAELLEALEWLLVVPVKAGGGIGPDNVERGRTAIRHARGER